LKLKEFFVPTTLEVGRIIRGFETASTLNFKKVTDRGKKTASRLTGARHYPFGAYEIERRSRGASRRKAAPTFVSGQLFLRDWRAALTLTLNNPLPRSPTSAHYSAHPRLLKDRRT
jgi:hypothetical protein